MANLDRTRRQLRQPRLGELVAESLRDRITSGLLRDGDMLPKQEELLDEFQVSKPSLREALRILETEGLITVRRGNVGGALVHAPDRYDAGYMIGLVLEATGVGVTDVADALRLLEPVCAGLCAERDDRAVAVVPTLRSIHERARAGIDDDIGFTALGREFHEALVAGCGNDTMIVVVGALESIWSARERDWAARATSRGDFPERNMRMEGVRAHERIIELIERGDSAAVERIARRHLQHAQIYASAGGGMVQASAVRSAAGIGG
jgi:GntR family transcriptional regulator, transcriptional repressor for pyruvate dehydrogenase complex